MLKLLGVSILMRRIKESPETRRRRLNAGDENETETDSDEMDSQSGTEPEPEPECGAEVGERAGAESEVAADPESELESCAAQESEQQPEESERPAERPKTALRRRTRSAAQQARVPESPPPEEQQRGSPQQWTILPRLSAGRLLGLAAAAVLLAVVTVRSADQLRQSQLPQRPRLTYGQWLAREGAGADEPPVLYRRRRLRFNTSAPVHVRWPEHSTCRRHVIRFARAGQLRSAALVTLPGSGATYLRYLLEGATGIFTSGSSVDVKLYNSGFYGQLHRDLDGSTVLQESTRGPHLSRAVPSGGHPPGAPPGAGGVGGRSSGGQSGGRTTGGRNGEKTADPAGTTGKTVLLVQDPHPALLEGRAAEGEKHTASDFTDIQWRQFVTLRMQQWSFHTQLAVDLADQLLVVYMEELQADPLAQLARVLQFLELTVPEERLACLLETPPPPPPAVHDPRPFRDASVRRVITEHVRHVQEMLRERGYVRSLEKYGRHPEPVGDGER